MPIFDGVVVGKVTLGGTVTKKSYPIAAQALEYREYHKAGDGEAEWVELARDDAPVSATTTYTVAAEGLAPDTEYEVRLTATDSQGNTAVDTLRFRTQSETPPSGVIDGKVEDPGAPGGTTITVTIEKGSTFVASQDSLSPGDRFHFEGLADGEYNLVAMDSRGYKVTQMVTIKDGRSDPLTVTIVGSTQSVVKVEPDAPEVAVDGLPGLFETDLYLADTSATQTVADGGTVEIRLTAGTAKNMYEKEQIEAHADGKINGLFVDLSVEMLIMPLAGEGTVKSIRDTKERLTVAIPLPSEAQGQTGYQLLRFHNGQVNSLTPIAAGAAPTEESFYVSGPYAYVFASKFSTYALYYDKASGGSSSSGGTNQKPPEAAKPVPAPDKMGVSEWLNTQDHTAYIIGRSDGLVHPEADITRAEVAMIFYRLLREDVRARYETSDSPFPDVEASAWYSGAVSTLAGADIITGRWDGTFGPDLPITRAEFAAIASRFASLPYTGTDLFSDTAGHWAREEINRAASYGWVNGVGDGTFAPDRAITRAEAIAIINRVLGRLPETAEDLLPGMKTWPDNAEADKWYYLPIQEATNGHGFDRKKDGIHETWTELTGEP